MYYELEEGYNPRRLPVARAPFRRDGAITRIQSCGDYGDEIVDDGPFYFDGSLTRRH